MTPREANRRQYCLAQSLLADILVIMTTLTVHDLDDEVRDGLRELANSHGRTIEEEAREILRGAVVSKRQAGPANGTNNLGSRIAARFSSAGGLDQGIPELRGQLAVPPDLAR